MIVFRINIKVKKKFRLENVNSHFLCKQEAINISFLLELKTNEGDREEGK